MRPLRTCRRNDPSMPRPIALLLIIILTTLAGDASGDLSPWIIYLPTAVSDACRGIRYDSPPGDSTGNDAPLLRTYPPVSDSAIVSSSTPYLLRPSNAPGKPLPLTDWMQRQMDHRQPVLSSGLGMFAVSVDSCWPESDAVEPELRRFWHDAPDSMPTSRCTPAIALIDTFGVRRATFQGARDPAWSPDGLRLAFRTVRSVRVRVNGRTLVYPEIPESTIVYSPESGKRETFPAAANVITWADDEFLVLENQSSSYGL